MDGTTSGMTITRIISPQITVIATSIRVGIPDGIKAAKVPLRIMAAEITTVPISLAARTIPGLMTVAEIAKDRFP